MGNIMAWYQNSWFYVERPFPWLLILVVSMPFLLIAAAVALGIWWFI